MPAENIRNQRQSEAMAYSAVITRWRIYDRTGEKKARTGAGIIPLVLLSIPRSGRRYITYRQHKQLL